MCKYFEVCAGSAIDARTGKYIQEQPFHMASRALYYAKKGDRLVVKDPAFGLSIATFGCNIPEEYMYTYMYQEEQNWSSYSGDFSWEAFSNEEYVFDKDCWFRICLKKLDGSRCNPEDAARVSDILTFRSFDEKVSHRPVYFTEEVYKTADKVMEQQVNGKSLVFALLADSHCTVNGTWNDTVSNIAAVHERVGLDGIIHLGDLSDGMLDKRTCSRIATSCINDMRKICEPIYLAIGNHDTNYFRGNTEWLTEEEQYAIYGRFNDRYVKRQGMKGYYYTDYDHVELRMIFLTSFDHHENIRYGFSEEEVQWLQRVLDETPDGYKVLIFGHDAPLAELDYWAEDIRNGERIMNILEKYHEMEGREVLAYIHGHTHADYVYDKRSFPIISVGCSKVEYFPDKKPEGSTRYMRKLGDVTQDLWDVLVVTPEKRRLEFVRFGAGEDRSVRPEVKVWAHRGASGYAPENTLEGFTLAVDMKADGVELDVQLTKDGQLVVTHDEQISRVSDGTGRVVDYTLEELKQFNFNKTHPEYADVCKIPTLREVLELLQDTGMTINIELKTGVNFYSGIEKKVVELVHEMGWQNRILYSSFNHCSVLKVREYDPDAKIAFLYMEQLSHVAEYALMNKVYAVNPSVLCTTLQDEMRMCREKNVNVNVWTVNTEEDMRRLKAMGVNAVITNYPDRARRIMEE